MNIQTTLDQWLADNHRASSSNQLKQLVKALDYRDVDDFLDDNSGCAETIIDWIGSHGTHEWKNRLSPVLRDDIQNLLDKNVIEFDEDNERYILRSMECVVLARWGNHSYSVGGISIEGDRVVLFDENDKLIDGGHECNYLQAFIEM